MVGLVEGFFSHFTTIQNKKNPLEKLIIGLNGT